MPIIKANFFFFDNAGYGWSEGIYNQGPDLTTALNEAIALLPYRIALNGLGVGCDFIRVSDELVFGDSKIYPVPSGDQYNSGSSVQGHAIANTCLLVNMRSSVITARRSLFLRGFQSRYVVNGQFQSDSGWNTRFNLWKQQVLKDNWALKVKDPVILSKQIISMTQDATTGRISVTTDSPHGLAQGNGITITGNKGTSQPNGNFTVYDVVSVTTFRINFNKVLGANTAFGKVRKYAYTLSKITEAQVMRAGHRDSGRPFNSPRGRRSKATRA